MQKKTNSTYQKTLDNKTYKLCHYQQQGLCCMGCVNRGRRGYYWLSGDDYKKEKDILVGNLLARTENNG